MFLLSSCISKPDIELVDLNNLSSFESYYVDPPKDKLLLIKNENGDTICLSNIPMTITKGIGINYEESLLDIKDYPDYKNKGVFDEYSTLCFEDTKNGDYDYNDLIIEVHSKLIYAGNRYKVKHEITPIALGSSKNISLYFETFNGNIYFITDDCRRDLFNGNFGFINTEGKFKQYKKHPLKIYELGNQNNWNNTRINWFIEVDGKRMYIATSNHNREYYEYMGIKGYPHGISLPYLDFNYLKEKEFIGNGYPDFTRWIKGQQNYFVEKTNYEYIYLK